MEFHKTADLFPLMKMVFFRDEENHRDKWKEAEKLFNISMRTIAKVEVIEKGPLNNKKRQAHGQTAPGKTLLSKLTEALNTREKEVKGLCAYEIKNNSNH